MRHCTYSPKGVCSTKIDYDLDDDNRIHNLSFTGGCNGNLKAIGRLCENADAASIADILRGNLCAMRGTSCADQFARSLDEALNQ
ncbi:MAG: TIGR03905 family TSCPD domain-containing protein [Lachnospiraceae bacterium]|nr:TIGR03905 family TSCPD domain-containing protein [Lachnospiraceae bacterium]